MDIHTQAIDINEVYKLTRKACGYYTKGEFTQEFDDLVQDVMMDVLRGLPNYDPAKGKLSTFIFKNTYLAIINYRIKQGAQKRWWVKNTASLDKIAGDEPLANYQHEDPLYEEEAIVADIRSRLTDDEKVLFEQIIGWIPNKEVVARTSYPHPDTVVRYRRRLISKIKEEYFDLL